MRNHELEYELRGLCEVHKDHSHFVLGLMLMLKKSPVIFVGEV